MAALNFPASPSVDDLYTANGRTWKWDGTSWNVVPPTALLSTLGDVSLTSLSSDDLLQYDGTDWVNQAIDYLVSSDIGTTVQAYDADTAKTDVAQAWTASQQGSTQTTSATGNTTLDFSTYQNFVITLTGNVTLDNPTTEAVGQSGFIVFIQDATGSRTVSLGTDYETAAGAGITLSTAAAATDAVPYIVVASGRVLLAAPQLGFS